MPWKHPLTERPESTQMAPAQATTNHRLHLIPHTHWDREWYLSHESFRLRLVDLVDHLIDLLEADPDFRFFHLDGQTIMLDDYLEIRPHQRERLATLIRDGRILIGPWYLQNDEFLTSGEATVRNLLMGRTACRDGFGVDPMPVGYVPDQFGNISQLPQILRGFDMDCVVYGRGYAGPADRAEFLWRSPDGSEVLAVHMFQWYNNAQRLPRDPQRCVAMCRELIEGQARRAQTPHLLLMNGVDHLEAQENLSAIIREVNALKPGFQLVASSLPQYIDAVRATLDGPTASHMGEFREGNDGSVLPGTASSRIHLKQANFELQNELERWVEPFSVMVRVLGGKHDARDAIDYAWRVLIQNHPHDSICGCSIDEVHFQMEARFGRVRDVLRDQFGRRMRHLAACVDTRCTAHHSVVNIMNPLPRRRDEVLEATLDTLEDEDITRMRLVDAEGREVDWQVLDARLVMPRVLNPKRLPKSLKVMRHRVLIDGKGIPGTGCKALMLVESKSKRRARSNKRPRRLVGAAIELAGVALENEHLRADFRANGTFDLTLRGSDTVFRGLHLLEDAGDAGNEYLFMKPEHDEPLTSAGLEARLEVLEASPLRQSVRVTWLMMLPPEVDDRAARRAGRPVAYRVVSLISLRRGARFVEIETTLDNTVKDHRLRALFPTGLHTNETRADAPFDIVRRPFDMKTDGRANHHPMQTFFAVTDGRSGLAVFSAGMPEFEASNPGAVMALTLLRCVDLLGDMPPQFWEREQLVDDFTPAAQCLRPYRFRYAVFPYASMPDAEVHAEAQRFVSPPRAHQHPADRAAWAGTRLWAPDFFNYFEDEASERPEPEKTSPAEQGLLEIDNPRVALSAVKFPHRTCTDRDWGGRAVVRLVNLSDRDEACRLRFGMPLAAAARAKLSEELTGEIPVVDGCAIDLQVPAKRVETLVVRIE
jgi:alpha-mannosidase